MFYSVGQQYEALGVRSVCITIGDIKKNPVISTLSVDMYAQSLYTMYRDRKCLCRTSDEIKEQKKQ